jgi:pimeloyl-ACP methyl ester carboxylesterase
VVQQPAAPPATALLAPLRAPGADERGRLRPHDPGRRRLLAPLLAFPEKDHVLPRRRYGQRLIDAIPHAEVIDLPGVGHAPMSDDPELVAQTILRFTQRGPGSRRALLASGI